MRAETEGERAAGGEAVVWVLKGYIRLAAVALGGIGLLMLYGSLGEERLLAQREALFGLTNRTFLVLAGLGHLGMSGCLFAVADPMSQGILTLWAGFCGVGYRLGMAWVGANTPLAAARLVGWKIGLSPRVVDTCWKLFIAYLLMGSLLHLMLAWRRLKRLEAEAALAQWRGMRGGGGSH